MIQLEPREYFAICRQLSDPADTNTYYIRAVIRNAKTDDLLDTVDLDNQGDQRFRSEWQVPADPSGDGFYITITTTVYTDSGYTNKSSLYGIAEEELLVQKRYNPVYGHGGGVGVDYKKMREIVRQELGIAPKEIDMNPIIKSIKGIKIPKQSKQSKQKEPDLSPITEAIKEIQIAIRDIHIPEPEHLNLLPVIREIKNIKIPEPEKLDLSPVLKGFEEITKRLEEITDQNIRNEKTLRIAEEDKKSLKEKIERLTKAFSKGYSLNVGPLFIPGMKEEEVRETAPKRRKFL